MGMSLGDPGMITAGQPVDGPDGRVTVRAASGRLLTDEDSEFVVVLGADLAHRAGVGVGDTLTIRGHDFTVVGVLDPTLSPADTTAMIPLAPGQRLYGEALPAVIRGTVPEKDLATQITVIPQESVSDSDLAARIEAAEPHVRAVTASSFQESVGSSVALLNAIIVGVALISLVVGGLSVINTMAMSVQERTREIGIKRAIGGSRGRVVRELVGEAALMGAIGGLIGLALGALVIWLANEAGRSSGTILFDLTPGTAVQALLFSTLLGMLAGLVPAWSAARLDPVQAIRND
jgi:putative ABC transport system permease protein